MYDVRSQDNDYLYEKQFLKKGHILWLLGSSHVLFLVIQMWAFLNSSLSCVLTYPFLYVCYIFICGTGEAISTTTTQATEELPSHTPSVYFLVEFPGTRVTRLKVHVNTKMKTAFYSVFDQKDTNFIVFKTEPLFIFVSFQALCLNSLNKWIIYLKSLRAIHTSGREEMY